MICYPATDKQIEWIRSKLESAKNRLKSGDFLHGFPWESTIWYGCDLEHSELERLFLFWDGEAWDESPTKLPRRLWEGVSGFMQIESDPKRLNTDHLNEIIVWLKRYEKSEIHDSEPFLILAGIDKNNPLLILDGNHRVSAALWWADKNKDRSKIPQKAWIGLSPDMVRYWYYYRILQHKNR